MAKKQVGVLVREQTHADVHRLADIRDMTASELGAQLFEQEVAKAKRSGELPKQ